MNANQRLKLIGSIARLRACLGQVPDGLEVEPLADWEIAKLLNITATTVREVAAEVQFSAATEFKLNRQTEPR